MRITRIVPPNATLYEQKCARIDAASDRLQDVSVAVCVGDDRFDDERFDQEREEAAGLKPGLRRSEGITHVYAPRAFVTRETYPRRWWQRRGARQFITPLKDDPAATFVAEAVGDEYFEVHPSGTVVGSILRPSVKNAIEQTMHRLGRTRDDVEWEIFESIPRAADLARIGVWVDPAIDDRDFDGGTAEALVAGCVVIGTRTPINRQRCEEGRSAMLVPANDPNEMTHAILSALFKPESGQQRAAAARQTIGKFRARQRMRMLSQVYDALLQ